MIERYTEDDRMEVEKAKLEALENLSNAVREVAAEIGLVGRLMGLLVRHHHDILVELRRFPKLSAKDVEQAVADAKAGE